MRVYYVVAVVRLVLTLACLAFLIGGKDLCAFKDPRSTLPQPQMDCHTSLIQTTFGVDSHLEHTGNDTAVEKPTPFLLKTCMQITERDIYRRPSSLSPLLTLLLPVCLLVVETFLIVLQTARVVTSYQVSDLVATIFANVLHGICWVGTAVTLYLVRLFWDQNWTEISPEFVPVYPMEYFYAEEIAWLCILAILAETTLGNSVIYHNLILEGSPRIEEEPPRLIATYRDDNGLLNDNN